MTPKATVRKALLAQRRRAHEEQAGRRDEEETLDAQAKWLNAFVSPGQVLGAYNPIRSERDPAPLLVKLGGRPLAFPKVPGPDQPLVFFATNGPQDLAPGAFGVLEPLETLPRVRPRAILVPLVGFDEAGYRMGYGGGFYDRTLATLGATAIGFAYDGQLSDQPLNFEATDKALDYLMTPLHLWDFTEGKGMRRDWHTLL